MIVFNSYFKIARKNLSSMLMPIVILVAFLGMFVFGNFYSSNATTTLSKPTISFVGLQNTEFDQGLKSYLEQSVNIEDVNEDKIKDALFREDIDAAIIVEDESITVKPSINAKETYWIEYQTNQYMKYFQSFKELGYTSQEAVEAIVSDQSYAPTLTLVDTANRDAVALNSITMLYQSMAYPLSLAIFSMIITSLFMFQRNLIRNRQRISSMSSKEYNFQLGLGTLILGHLIWALTMLLIWGSTFNFLVDEGFMFRLLNSYMFMISILALAFLFSKLTKSLSLQSVFSQGGSLALSFISGIFVPQEFLGPVILWIARFTPFYWYASFNTLISYSEVNPLQIVGIQSIFTIIFVLIALILDRNKKEAR